MSRNEKAERSLKRTPRSPSWTTTIEVLHGRSAGGTTGSRARTRKRVKWQDSSSIHRAKTAQSVNLRGPGARYGARVAKPAPRRPPCPPWSASRYSGALIWLGFSYSGTRLRDGSSRALSLPVQRPARPAVSNEPGPGFPPRSGGCSPEGGRNLGGCCPPLCFPRAELRGPQPSSLQTGRPCRMCGKEGPGSPGEPPRPPLRCKVRARFRANSRRSVCSVMDFMSTVPLPPFGPLKANTETAGEGFLNSRTRDRVLAAKSGSGDNFFLGVSERTELWIFKLLGEFGHECFIENLSRI
ncbi:hypothetical protein SUGI_1143330 [Cryptomeria japonica]|nr:hypothetical protein SUGI_1143330 [Cryptomeria japonica]